MKQTFLYLLLLFALFSCASSVKPKEDAEPVIATDTCASDHKNTYEVYIPERKTVGEKLPLLVIIDSHASGKFALEKFKKAANEHHAILLASNLVKNGFAGYVSAIKEMITDASQKYPVNGTVFMTGFSGGARMSLAYASTNRIDGLIMCGALGNTKQITAVKCPVVSISGTDDFNFAETAQFLFQEHLIPGNLKIELTDASHSWPDSTTLSNMFAYLVYSNSADTKTEALNEFSKKQLKLIEQLKKAGDYLKAYLVARNLSKTSPFNTDKTFESKLLAIKNSAEFVNQMKRLKECLTFEMSNRQQYVNALIDKDTLWWKTEIAKNDSLVASEQDRFVSDMYKRIKAFWGIACYSLSNQAKRASDPNGLDKVISVYKILEPENPDMFYFSAYSYLLKQNTEKAVFMLKNAQKYGFSDNKLMQKDFPRDILSQLR